MAEENIPEGILNNTGNTIMPEAHPVDQLKDTEKTITTNLQVMDVMGLIPKDLNKVFEVKVLKPYEPSM